MIIDFIRLPSSLATHSPKESPACWRGRPGPAPSASARPSATATSRRGPSCRIDHQVQNNHFELYNPYFSCAAAWKNTKHAGCVTSRQQSNSKPRLRRIPILSFNTSVAKIWACGGKGAYSWDILSPIIGFCHQPFACMASWKYFKKGFEETDYTSR